MTPAAAVRERPILCTGESVRATIDGRKTQTRRVVKPQPVNEDPNVKWGWAWRKSKKVWFSGVHEYQLRKAFALAQHCPYGLPGDRLWVREGWRMRSVLHGEPWVVEYRDGGSHALVSVPGTDAAMDWEDRVLVQSEDDYRSVGLHPANEDGFFLLDGMDNPCRWRPSIHMPRWASRITLEVTGVRVERVQEICELECYAEGISQDIRTDPDDHMERVIDDFRLLWDSINAKRGYSWDSNPWVWVVEFERVEP